METPELDYKVIGTGSKGNAVRIENIMIDCGLAYTKMKKDLYLTDLLLITHAHSDHVKPSTFNRIVKDFPNIKRMGNPDVGYRWKLDKVLANDVSFEEAGWKITPFPCLHDVPTQGFVLEKDDLKIIYATDTSTLEFAPNMKFDYFFVESNHDESKVDLIKSNSKYGYDAWQGAMRHLSTQKAKAYYYIHRKDKDSKWIELHQSSRFY